MKPEATNQSANSTMFGSKLFTTAIDHPRLTVTEATSARLFIKKYDSL